MKQGLTAIFAFKIIYNMNNQFLVILFVFMGSVFYTPAHAQSLSVSDIENSVKKDGKYALLISNANYFPPAVISGAEMKANNPKINFEIVLVGPVVKDLADDPNLISFIETSEKAGIRIVVCEFAMKKMGVTEADYPSSIETTPDGFVYLFGLQESGFKTITL